jgi:hypothetical protein
MKQNVTDKAEKIKGELKHKGWVVFEWIVAIVYFVLLIYFVFRPLTEFLFMVEYNIKVGILNYFFN